MPSKRNGKKNTTKTQLRAKERERVNKIEEEKNCRFQKERNKQNANMSQHEMLRTTLFVINVYIWIRFSYVFRVCAAQRAPKVKKTLLSSLYVVCVALDILRQYYRNAKRSSTLIYIQFSDSQRFAGFAFSISLARSRASTLYI